MGRKLAWKRGPKVPSSTPVEEGTKFYPIGATVRIPKTDIFEI